MFRRTRLAACVLSTAALLGPILPATSAHADVSQCAPLTIDGQEAACLALSSKSATDADGNPGLEVSFTLAVFGLQPVTQVSDFFVPLSTINALESNVCTANNMAAWSYGGTVGYPDANVTGVGMISPDRCLGVFGLALASVPASVSPPDVSLASTQISEPYHVPQLCLTTSPGVCVGPYDGTITQSVPTPSVTWPHVTPGFTTRLCPLVPTPLNSAVPWFYTLPGAESTGSAYDGSLCVPVQLPVGIPNP